MIIGVLALNSLENVINGALVCNNGAQQQLPAFSGQAVAFELREFDATFYMLFSDRRLLLQQTYRHKVDLTISGTVTSFAKLASSQHGTLPTEVTMAGSVQLAQQLQSLFASLRLDWQSLLTMLCGKPLATGIAVTADKGQAWLKYAAHRWQLNATEFIQQELRVLPCRESVDHFCRQVDNLRHRIARLEARLQPLLSKRPEDY